MGEIAAVVHDFRSPLSAVMLLADALAVGAQRARDPLAYRQATLIRGATFAMQATIDDLRDTTRPVEALIDDSPRRFDAASLTGPIVHLVSPITEVKGVALIVSAPPYIEWTGYPTVARRVLLNLVANALTCTEHGRVTLRIEADPERFHATVEDTGAGLPPYIAAAFGGTAWRAGGAGLGLALCTRLTRAVGGSVALLSTGPQGTRIAVDLPCIATSGGTAACR